MARSRFAPEVLAADPRRRSRILPVLDAALDAVDPQRAVAGAIAREGDTLHVAGRSYALDAYRQVLVLSIGKAAVAMCRALCAALNDRPLHGIALTKYGHTRGCEALPATIATLEAGHPTPDSAGIAAAQQVARLAEHAGRDDLVICLVSGGGSALLTLPAAGLSLADLQDAADTLLRCGAAIGEINTLRKHLEQLKGGQLARLAAPASVVTLALSDVVGSPLDVIASGPTVPDRSTWADAWQVVQRYDLAAALPPAVTRHLRQGLAGELADTPKPGETVFAGSQATVVADNALAAQAAQAEARHQGFDAHVLTTFVEGEAREVARLAVALGREAAIHQRPARAPACLILGGETTVTVRGNGVGGRNQELALAAALQLQHIPQGERIVVVSLASDGADGPTDAAGAIGDSGTAARAALAGLDAAAHLAANNAYPLLKAAGDLLMTGPTQTNVNDLILIFVF